ncbi:DUF4345 domain-containing protein [Phaeobacter sp. PT47_59]|uniref:DUF4345 domain-containing protein n=1 Tax=Phaeobacter sp. PT47_59 TaxID=3029979 RepID=UPI0023808AAF|nr:DUF4345 domain-containing protein [Phaeobacter sp. PT47_59]MDE4174762.1 DUF4345 domain-containing protein [Phaeobacter sp. PT47_59]
MSYLIKPFLFLSAAVLMMVGVMLSFAPEVLYASSGQVLQDSVLIRSDLRAGGMLLLLSGVFVLWAALRGNQIRPALQLSALIYLGYGLGRIVSIALDGAPDATLVTVTAIEWALGLGALALMRQGKTAGTGQALAAG